MTIAPIPKIGAIQDGTSPLLAFAMRPALTIEKVARMQPAMNPESCCRVLL